MDTHYLGYFTTIHQRLQMAVCGRVIDTRQHSAEPTCPKCAAWLAADTDEAEALASKWDAEEAEKRTMRTAVTR